MDKKTQRKILEAWNEIEEIACDLRDLTNKELTECRKCIKGRADKAMGILEDFIDEDIFQEVIK